MKKRPSAQKQLARQWAVLQMLAGRSHTVAEIAKRTGAAKSNIERDLRVLARVFPLRSKQGRFCGDPWTWWLDTGAMAHGDAMNDSPPDVRGATKEERLAAIRALMPPRRRSA